MKMKIEHTHRLLTVFICRAEPGGRELSSLDDTITNSSQEP